MRETIRKLQNKLVELAFTLQDKKLTNIEKEQFNEIPKLYRDELDYLKSQNL
jgi:hypothetical protein